MKKASEMPQETIQRLAGSVKRLLQKQGEVGEQNTKAVLVEPMLQALGWDIHELDEVQREFRYRSDDNPVDYALLVSGIPCLFVEVKNLGRDLGQRKWKTQAVNYANTSGVDWCILTDGNFWQIFKSNAPGDLDQKLFLETWIYSPDGSMPPFDPHFIFNLLCKDKFNEKKIENLWQVLDIDKQGRDAIIKMIETKDEGLIRLIKKQTNLSKKQIGTFLARTKITVETPNEPPAKLDDFMAGPPRRIKKREKKTVSRKGRHPLVPGLPSQKMLEIPLLKAILARGGSINISEKGKEIYAELARQFGLAKEQQEIMLRGKTETVWSNRVRWTRLLLVKSGDIDKGRYGIWALTAKGKARAES